MADLIFVDTTSAISAENDIKAKARDGYLPLVVINSRVCMVHQDVWVKFSPKPSTKRWRENIPQNPTPRPRLEKKVVN